MNIRIARYVGICLLLIIGIFVLYRRTNLSLLSIGPYPTPHLSETSLSNAMIQHRSGELPVIDLATVTTFSWDRVYIFGPYTQPSEISIVAGKAWRDSCFTTIDTYEGYTLLLFTRKSQAVGCIEHPRNEGDFASLAVYESGFSPIDARFVIGEHGEMVWIGVR